ERREAIRSAIDRGPCAWHAAGEVRYPPERFEALVIDLAILRQERAREARMRPARFQRYARLASRRRNRKLPRAVEGELERKRKSRELCILRIVRPGLDVDAGEVRLRHADARRKWDRRPADNRERRRFFEARDTAEAKHDRAVPPAHLHDF